LHQSIIPASKEERERGEKTNTWRRLMGNVGGEVKVITIPLIFAFSLLKRNDEEKKK
jgi:hypothetical protein